MKKIFIIVLILCTFVIYGCNDDDNPIEQEKNVIENLKINEEELFVKYYESNENKKTYLLNVSQLTEMVSILNNLKGTEIESADLNVYYQFKLGEYNIKLNNSYCMVNDMNYKISYNFEGFFDNCSEYKEKVFGEGITLPENIKSIIVYKFISNSNEVPTDPICLYEIKDSKLTEFIAILNSLEVDEKAGEKGMYHYTFQIGDIDFILTNNGCITSDNVYLYNYDFDSFFDNCEVYKETINFSEICDLTEVTEIIIERVNSNNNGELKLTKEDEILAFISNIKDTNWYEYYTEVTEEYKQYVITVNNNSFDVFKYDNLYYVLINEKLYCSDDSLDFLDKYVINTSSGWLPWV